MLNADIKEGDEIILYHMHDEISIPPGTRGTIKNVQRDPFEDDNTIVNVRWEDGSSLSLLTKYDVFKVVKKNIDESSQISGDFDPYAKWMDENRDMRKTFDLPFFKKYFTQLRDSGITNMLGSSNFVYMDSEHLDRYHGEGREDDEEFQKLMAIQDETRDKFIFSLVKYAAKNKININDDHAINRLAQKLASRLLTYYITFF